MRWVFWRGREQEDAKSPDPLKALADAQQQAYEAIQNNKVTIEHFQHIAELFGNYLKGTSN